MKSSPAVDPKTGLVFAGSHDGYVYALNPLVRFQRCKKITLKKSYSFVCVHPDIFNYLNLFDFFVKMFLSSVFCLCIVVAVFPM